MKLPTSFPDLEDLVYRMGAKKVVWTPKGQKLEPPDISRLLERSSGLEVSIDKVSRGPAGLITYKERQVILYIREGKGRSDRHTLLHHPEDAQRFHVAFCETLETMIANGRLQRYVVTTNRNGLFTVIATDPFGNPDGEVEARLKVCKKCLKYIGYKGYKYHGGDVDIWKRFDIGEFFDEYKTLFPITPQYTDRTAPPPGYPDDWAERSTRYRESIGWRCEQCGVDLSGRHDLLHTHHINGVTGDNSSANLRALCVVCHAEQPSHRMHVKPEDRSLIERLRRGIQ